MSEDNAVQPGSSDSYEAHHGAKQTTTTTAGSVFELSRKKNLTESVYLISSMSFCFGPHAWS